MKKTKKALLLAMLLLSMSFSAMPTYVAPVKETKVEAETIAIPISNADELYNINNDLGGSYYLTADIDMQSYEDGSRLNIFMELWMEMVTPLKI